MNPIALKAPAVSATASLSQPVHQTIQAQHYRPRTEVFCLKRINRTIFFHREKLPADKGETEPCSFLSHLAEMKSVTASMQKQAPSLTADLKQKGLVIYGVEVATPPGLHGFLLLNTERGLLCLIWPASPSVIHHNHTTISNNTRTTQATPSATPTGNVTDNSASRHPSSMSITAEVETQGT
jgi:hypothetical protein